MKAAIISLGSKSSQWSYEAMLKYFDEVDALDIREIELDISGKPKILYKGKPLPDYDCIYAKGSFRFAMALRAVTDILKSSGKKIYLPYEAEAYTSGHDKILSHLRMLHNGVPTPLTYISSSPDAAKNLLQKMNYPIIMKIPSGTQGKGVMFADSIEAATSMLDTLTTLRQPFLIQEYIETGGVDLRVIVIGDKVVAAMERMGSKDDKRANLHAGGKGRKALISEEAKRVAKKTAKALGADICGVDILDSEVKGPLVIEANMSPGLQGVTEATGVDVADAIAKFLAKKTKEMLNEDKKTSSKEVLVDLEHKKEFTLITNLKARGAKLILPEEASKMSKIDDETEVELSLKKGSINIKKVG